MSEEELNALRFPIGKFKKPEAYTKEVIASYIWEIENFPAKIRKETENLSDEQLDTPYRPDGWTIRQVVHHCADSHINSFTRFKLALTEDTPSIKPYFEDRWAELADSKTMPVQSSLNLLETLHQRWVILLKSMHREDFKKEFFHPESKRKVSLEENTGTYAWHGNHHLAHIAELKKRKGWS